MQTIREKLQPVLQQYNRFINGHYLSDLLQFKGGSSIGNDYVSKVFLSQYKQIVSKYETTLDRINNPTLSGFFSDNWPRLILLNAADRLIAAYQVYPTLKKRFTTPGTYSHIFTQITNQGAFKGTLKGLSMSLLQFSSVLFPSAYIASRTQEGKKRYFKFLTSYTFFDALLYPLDTVKNILYAETAGVLNLRSILQHNFFSLYSGLGFKLAFNVPLVSAFYFTSQSGCEFQAFIFWLITAAMFPVNTNKVISQLSITEISTLPKTSVNLFTSYRGVIPFLLLNSLVGWQLRMLYNKDKVKEISLETMKERQRILQ